MSEVRILPPQSLLPAMMVLLFLAVPLGMGYAIPGATAARVAWLAFGAMLAVSQSRDADLGGAWVIVVLVVLIGLLPVELGHRLRLRRRHR